MIIRTSFSQDTCFKCPRKWYFKYKQRLPDKGDKCYANAGTAVHDTLEYWYSNKFKDLNEAKEFYEKKWYELKVHTTKLSPYMKTYWNMIINGIKLELSVTKTEMKISFDDVYGKLDVVDENYLGIDDWKTSVRTSEKDLEYLHQLKYYCYLYYRKFKILPKRVRVFYLRYTGPDGVFEHIPTIDDVKEMEQWHNNTIEKIKEVLQKDEVPCTGVCDLWCPYEEECKKQKETALNIHLQISGNFVYIKGPITNMLLKGIDKKSTYELDYPDWLLKHNPDIQKEFKLFDSKYNRVPIGLLDNILKTINDYAKFKKIDANINLSDLRKFNKTVVLMPDMFFNDIVPRDYQYNAVDAFIRKKIGVLQIGTGGGKTITSMEIIRQLQMKTLFIVDKVELVRQTKKVIKQTLGIDAGIIGTGKKEFNNITIATVQTIAKTLKPYSRLKADKTRIKNKRWKEFAKTTGTEEPNKKKLSKADYKRLLEVYNFNKKEYIKKYKFTDEEKSDLNVKRQIYFLEEKEIKEYLGTVRLAIFDECHKVAAFSYGNIAFYLKNTEYRLGLSGTAFREDGHDMQITAVVGNVVYDLSSKKLIEKGWLVKPKVIFIKNYMTKQDVNRKTIAASRGLINETPSYPDYYNHFIYMNEFRNNVIQQIETQSKGRSLLILTKLVDHGKLLQELIPNSKHLYGGTNKTERENLLNDFSEGKFNVLISTLSIFAEGVNIPRLQDVINTSCNSGNVKTIQTIGRILRKLNDTKDAIYYDFLDESKFFRSASLARIKALAGQGHDVVIKEYNLMIKQNH